ncbi:Myb-like DNA-binding domain containing protein [Trichomonas vaginalis G3]|uniref:Myb-like DNA-binding domain containing protein n=1 Tax=Trichomonas vaginalis (strain ATCC PRA-98 / G3) TaxID=412133 RepID=A2DSS9_TRIV3|nr:RNA polymerase II transcription regulator recruiting protein [Trichomonas vaginalis G3]EAY16478.1 Myb-like DNA-binding domain containing protein [Trichomonas vaginalis G3]KAI5493596.1 RNA polymerase II transcription regulator recruiting protein [Trichomonas vaginalis G3]|eukprot:XP_001328701.1 Myb-like DNA-binding domain containing protein [Trichomonas vaginalis G3]
MFDIFNDDTSNNQNNFTTPRNINSFISDPHANEAPAQTHFGSQYKKSKWTPEEDRALIESVRIHGTKNWIAVANLVPDRNSKQCRERWTAQLDPSLNHNEFTPQEDAVIILQHQANGPYWAKIAAYLPGRSATAIKNRFNWLSRRHLPQKMNKFFLSGTTPMEPSSSSGSMSPLGIAPFALSDPSVSQMQKPQETEPHTDVPDDIFTQSFFDNQEDDVFNF